MILPGARTNLLAALALISIVPQGQGKGYGKRCPLSDSTCAKLIIHLYLVSHPLAGRGLHGLPEQPPPRVGPVAQVARAHP